MKNTDTVVYHIVNLYGYFLQGGFITIEDLHHKIKALLYGTVPNSKIADAFNHGVFNLLQRFIFVLSFNTDLNRSNTFRVLSDFYTHEPVSIDALEINIKPLIRELPGAVLERVS